MEEVKPYGYIYKTTNLINGKIYIGKKESPEFDPNYKGSGSVLGKAFKKYGKENFKVEFLFYCFSKEELNEEERAVIALFDCRVRNGKGYNVSEGGDWGNVTEGMTPEQYQDYCRKIGDAHRGRPKSEEHKQKLRESNLGKKRSKEVCKKLSNSHIGKTWTNESKLKLQRTKASPEYRERMSSVWKNRTYHKTCVVCGKKFTSKGSEALYCSEECKLSNLSVGTSNHRIPTNYQHTEETKLKISKALSGENNPFYGKKHDDSARKKMSDAARARHADPDYVDPRKGTTRSAETKALISEARKKQKFKVKCKQCGKDFSANSPNKYQVCPRCKEVMISK